ncbi:PLP-dependent aminotransferase family protein [Streptomyces sp. NBC_01506]|uniref:aminotransferase-like domain-containing protein n=1 Tax=Streptomyces sp. NBC_01506 TaxID=2903887 RepID=UPI0038668723
MRDSWANAASGGEPAHRDGERPAGGKRQVTAVTVGADLHLELRGPGLRTGLMDALREAVRTGRLTPGTRLPSSRSLAADLGVARNTVADAYAELVAEGWLTARQGSGTRVARRAAPRTAAPSRPPAPPVRRSPAHNLRAGTPDLGSFPRGEWLAAARRALTAAPHDAFDYGDRLGRVELRTALADYLARTRGVYADPERVVLCSGFAHGLSLMAQALAARRGRAGVARGGAKPGTKTGARGGTKARARARARAMAVESYGLDFHRSILTGAGLRTPVLPIDELGTRTEELAAGRGELRGVDAVLTTPAHQFPTGAALHPDRRAAMVDWARGAGGLILEDDYDGEFRYDRQPVDPTPWQLRKQQVSANDRAPSGTWPNGAGLPCEGYAGLSSSPGMGPGVRATA